MLIMICYIVNNRRIISIFQAVDMEMRKLEVTQANTHVKYLTSYMPDSFHKRGGQY